MKRISIAVTLILSGVLTVLLAVLPAGAATAPPLGTAEDFAVLAGTTVTNTGSTVITGGDLGVSPGSAVTGFPPGVVTPPGEIHAGDAVAAQAQNDVTTAYNNLAGQACDQNLTGQDLGGKTLLPGTYCFDTSAQLTGSLTLDAQGDPDSVFIFQIASTLTTASNSSVGFINGTSCHVYWQVGSSATLGTTTDFTGNVLALESITANTGATTDGRLLARNGATTMDTNVIDISDCSPLPTPEPSPSPSPTAEPSPSPSPTAEPSPSPSPSPTPAPSPTGPTDDDGTDSDGDGLSDGDEVNVHGTNPLDADSDGDGLSDGDEVNVHGTNPLDADSDGDTDDELALEEGSTTIIEITNESTTTSSAAATTEAAVPTESTTTTEAATTTVDDRKLPRTGNSLPLLPTVALGLLLIVAGNLCLFAPQPSTRLAQASGRYQPKRRIPKGRPPKRRG